MEATSCVTADLLKDLISSKQSFNDCWSVIAPLWPLENFVCVNPLEGFETYPFQEGLSRCLQLLGHELPMPMQRVNQECLKWLPAFFDNGQAVITLPNQCKGLLTSVRAMLLLDRSFKRRIPPECATFISQLPSSSEDVIASSLVFLGVDSKNSSLFLSLVLASLPGWSAFVKQQEEQGLGLYKTDYLALRLLITCALYPKAQELLTWHLEKKPKFAIKTIMSSLADNETQFRSFLFKQLRSSFNSAARKHAVAAQFIFCIDARSESIRKKLEHHAGYQTFGVAGFFGALAAFSHLDSKAYPSCPVLLKPKKIYNLKSNSSRFWDKIKTAAKGSFEEMKNQCITPFALVESTGIFAYTKLIHETLYSLLHKNYHNHRQLAPCLDGEHDIEFEYTSAKQFLLSIGMVKHFAPLIFVIGHHGLSRNNLYASSLDCGACGGRPGGLNAQLMASFLNHPSVRVRLKKDGIHIPESTEFVSGEHNTTLQLVTLHLNQQTKHPDLLLQIQQDLNAIHCQLKDQLNNQATSPLNWANVRPEWGLANNAALIIGPRSYTQNLSLDNRCFLHSYDWTQDSEGTILKSLLQGPLIVAYWINMQYLCSTLFPGYFSSGSKITHNLTGKIGVMQGAGSDLMPGLPVQSVYKDDQTQQHQAARLSCCIIAPLSSVHKVLTEDRHLQQLVSNSWLFLDCLDPTTGKISSVGNHAHPA